MKSRVLFSPIVVLRLRRRLTLVMFPRFSGTHNWKQNKATVAAGALGQCFE